MSPFFLIFIRDGTRYWWRDDETEYDLIKEVPKQTNLKVYISKDYSNVFHCWKAVNVFYYLSFSKIPCYHSEIFLQIL